MMHGHEKSDPAIVAEKPANKAKKSTAVEALNAIKATTCLIDGEAVTCSEAGLADFDGSQKRFGEALETRGLPGSNCDWYRMSVYHASGNMIGWRGRPVAFDALASGVQQNQG